VHEVLQTYLDDITKGTAPLDYEIKSWQDLDRGFCPTSNCKRGSA
jgi:hypothetical protein